MTAIRRLCLLAFILAMAALLTVALNAQEPGADPRALRVKLVALDDSIRRTEARRDSIVAELACLRAIDPQTYGLLRGCFRSLQTVTVVPPPDPAERELLVAGVLSAGVGLNALLALNTDPGGYADSWRTPDKAAHAAIAAALTFAGAEMGARPWIAAALVCAAGYGFEHTQGTVSSRDAWANCGGAALATGFTYLARRWR